MKQLCYSLCFFLLSVFHGFVNPCDIIPFPPFPPSPPEFSTPLSISPMADAVLIEWSPLMDTDGYIVSVCRPEEGQYKAIARTTGSHLLVNAFSSPGLHYFRVAGYVEVGDTRVFNTGLIGQMAIEADMIPPGSPEESGKTADTDKPSLQNNTTKETPKESTVVPEKSIGQSGSEQPVEIPDAAESGKPVNYTQSVQKIAEAHPGLNGASSVYNPFYPEATNPFFETIREDGTVIPPLLTNEAIDKTVARLQKKREEQGLVTVDFTAVVASASAQEPAKSGTVSEKQAVKQPAAAKTEPVVSGSAQAVKETPVSGKTPATQPIKELLNDVEKAKQNLAEARAEQALPSEPAQSPDLPKEPESSGFGLILTIAIILGVVYFVVAKEAK